MSALKAMASGAWRAFASPFVLLWLWIVNVAIAAPAAWLVARSIERSIGSSRIFRKLREGFDPEWFDLFSEQARGPAASFTPTHSGAGAIWDNLERFLTGDWIGGPLVVTVAAATHALVWLFMLGGAIDRLADRERRPGPRRYFTACGRYCFRLLRLALLSGVLYGAIYLLGWRLWEWMTEATRDVTVEGTIFYYGLLIWALVALLVTLVHAVFGFAKVATVVDERRSMLLAAVRGLVFVVRRPGKTLGLYYGFLLVAGLLLVLYAMVAPGIGQSTWKQIAWAFAAGQAFLLSRLYVRLALLGGQAALYRTEATAPSTRGELEAEPPTEASRDGIPLSPLGAVGGDARPAPPTAPPPYEPPVDSIPLSPAGETSDPPADPDDRTQDDDRDPPRDPTTGRLF